MRSADEKVHESRADLIRVSQCDIVRATFDRHQFSLGYHALYVDCVVKGHDRIRGTLTDSVTSMEKSDQSG